WLVAAAVRPAEAEAGRGGPQRRRRGRLPGARAVRGGAGGRGPRRGPARRGRAPGGPAARRGVRPGGRAVPRGPGPPAVGAGVGAGFVPERPDPRHRSLTVRTTPDGVRALVTPRGRAAGVSRRRAG